jgi:hypothetical protein
MINNSLLIRKNRERIISKPTNKYNQGLQMNAEELGVDIADYRGGNDAGSERELLANKQ